MEESEDITDQLESPVGAPSFHANWECPQLSIPKTPSVISTPSLEYVVPLREPLDTFMELQLACRVIRFIRVEAKDFPVELSERLMVLRHMLPATAVDFASDSFGDEVDDIIQQAEICLQAMWDYTTQFLTFKDAAEARALLASSDMEVRRKVYESGFLLLLW